MTSFFPDVNVWLSLSMSAHPHNSRAWNWMHGLPDETRIYFSRLTQIGLLRLLTSAAVMGERVLTVQRAWTVYDQWLTDTRVEFHPEPRGVDSAFRDATKPVARHPAAKAIADCYLLACARQTGSALVTFDAALNTLAYKQGITSLMP